MFVCKNNIIFLIILFFISFLNQALFFANFTNKKHNYLICTDSAEYMAISENIYNGDGIKKIDGNYNFRRLPGYPIFLSISNLKFCLQKYVFNKNPTNNKKKGRFAKNILFLYFFAK